VNPLTHLIPSDGAQVWRLAGRAFRIVPRNDVCNVASQTFHFGIFTCCVDPRRCDIDCDNYSFGASFASYAYRGVTGRDLISIQDFFAG